MFSTMSPTHRACFSEDKHRSLFDIPAQLPFAHRLGDDVDRLAEDFLDTLTERFEPAKIGEAFAQGRRVQAEKHIDIRGLGRVTTRRRSEYRQRLDARRSKFCLVCTEHR
jgi:hypothetical protein